MDQRLYVVALGKQIEKDIDAESAFFFKTELKDFEQGKDDKQKEEEIDQENPDEKKGLPQEFPDIRRNSLKISDQSPACCHRSLRRRFHHGGTEDTERTFL